jgi:DNA polymerase-3 subunit beta
MQLKQIARDALLKPLQAVSGIVERRHTLPILANVLIEHRDGELFVTATDLEMQITARTALPGKEAQAITVAARKLQDLLRALPDDATLNVDATGSKLAVRAGRSRFNLQTLPAADYPRIGIGQDQVQKLSLPQRDLRALIKAAEFAMAQQDIRYYLNGMLLVIDKDSLQAVATDGHRLSWASLKVDGDYERREVILPRKTVLELGKLLAEADDPVTIDVLTNQVRFAFANVELVSKVVDGKFPDYNRVIPTGHAKSIELPRTELLAALQRAAILSNEKFRGVRLVLGAGQLKIICSNSEQEEAEEEIEVDYRGDALDIGFNITYLLDVLQNQPVERVQVAFGDANSSALITIPERDDYKYVVMPMRI